MTIYVGEALVIVAAAVNPLSGAVITDATAEVDFFAPGKSPARVVADRLIDQGPYPLAFDGSVANKDGTLGAYVGYIDTDGWQPGKWTYRVALVGAYNTWEYATVTLVA